MQHPLHCRSQPDFCTQCRSFYRAGQGAAIKTKCTLGEAAAADERDPLKSVAGLQNHPFQTLSLMNAAKQESLPPHSSNQESGGIAVIEKEQQRIRKPAPRYKVLLHNDPINSMEYVVSTLRQVVPSLSEQDAISVMLEAHNTGIGLVIVCDIEPAEFYSESLKSKGLTSTIEPEA